jgi:hypothetical protein
MTDTCVSLTTGTLSPDQRVNYAYGMVLGVDEFLTEQQHRLEKGYRHDRALHGYGTVYGLHVTAGEAPDTADDVEVRVATGMLIDQYGREAVITCDQCARLGAWLAAQEQASPGTVASHRGPSGELIVYVVARYASCLDALVPLPGTPCSSSAQSSVASRIRDAWDVDLTFDLPPMPRWDTDRRLARLLGSVQIVAGLPQNQSSEDDIIAALLTLPSRAGDGPDDLFPDLSPSGSPSGLTNLRLPAETAAEALDRIFTVWVTQVRPFFSPDLTTPEAAQPSGPDGTEEILLSTIRFLAADPFDPLAPAITAFDAPDDEGRPYLLHTRLIQELRSLREAGQVVVRPRELVTLAPSVSASGQLSLDAWFHLPQPVSLDSQVDILTEAGFTAQFATSATDPAGNPVDFSDVWRLTAPANLVVRDGEQLLASFPTDLVFVGDNTTTLQDLEADGLVLLNSAGGQVVAFATVEVDPRVPDPPPPRPAEPSVEFLTVTTTSIDNELMVLELWFHPQPRGPRDDVFVIKEPAFSIFDEVTGNPVPIVQLGQDPAYRNVWEVTAKPILRDREPAPAYLRLVFRTREITVEFEGNQLSLAEWIEKAEILFVGWDRRDHEIIAFHRVAPGLR